MQSALIMFTLLIVCPFQAEAARSDSEGSLEADSTTIPYTCYCKTCPGTQPCTELLERQPSSDKKTIENEVAYKAYGYDVGGMSFGHIFQPNKCKNDCAGKNFQTYCEHHGSGVVG